MQGQLNLFELLPEAMLVISILLKPLGTSEEI